MLIVKTIAFNFQLKSIKCVIQFIRYIVHAVKLNEIETHWIN